MYLRVYGVLSRSGYIHQDEHHQVNKCQLALDNATAMDVEEGNGHRYQHGKHTQPIEGTGHEEGGTKQLGKDDEEQGNLTAYMHWVGEDEAKFGVVV